MTLKKPKENTLALYHEFASDFVEQALALLWSHWEQFGAGGQASVETCDWVLDPEALLWFTWQLGRVDPRLFDEALRWCCHFGEKVDVTRLGAFLKQERGENTDRELCQVAAGFASSVVAHSGQKRWSALQRLASEEAHNKPLFLTKKGGEQPMFGEPDPHFAAFGLLRGTFQLRGKPVAEVPIDAQGRLRLLLRHLFGMGTRAEVLVLLLTHRQITPREAAFFSYYTSRGMQQTLEELAASGLVFAQELPGQKRRYAVKSYALEKSRWWGFFAPSEGEEEVSWCSWKHVFAAMSSTWTQIRLLHQDNNLTPFKIRSRLREGAVQANTLLSHGIPSRLDYPIPLANAASFVTPLAQNWQELFADLLVRL